MSSTLPQEYLQNPQSCQSTLNFPVQQLTDWHVTNCKYENSMSVLRKATLGSVLRPTIMSGMSVKRLT